MAARPATGDPQSTEFERALADAVRQQLAHPGSISPQRQLELYLADHAGGDPAGGKPSRHRGQWTPFRAGVDPCPYRPLAEGSWDGSVTTTDDAASSGDR